ncbi:T9SS type A sorting domain-containing protein [candidate division KSB1 bacterium]|nr:T9SS type A sorting domain-containing protein [candidate division KSB1 bacterium]
MATGYAASKSFVLNTGTFVTLVNDSTFDHAILPEKFMLAQNYPNPFNPGTKITYSLPVVSDVKIRIYNVLGQVVRIIERGNLPAGVHQVEWDGRDDLGRPLMSGIYYYRISADGFSDVKKMLMVK